MFKRYTKNGKLINATEKAYNLIYKFQGYRPLDETAKKQEIIDYQKMTKGEIGEILTQKGIDYNPRDKKEVLISLLLECG